MSNWEQWAKWVKGTTSDTLVRIQQLGAGLALEVLGPFALRSTGAAYNLLIRSVEVFTASRTLTVGLNNADRTLTVAGDATISGTNTGDQTITLTGDVTGSGTSSFATTLATVNASPGTYPNATVTVNAKGLVTAATGGQVLAVVKTDTFSTTTVAPSWEDVTGLSQAITLTDASNRVLVMVSGFVGQSSNDYSAFVRLVRGSTALAVGDAAGNRTQASSGGRVPITGTALPIAITTIDTPGSTGPHTYKLQMAIGTGSNTAYLNRTGADGNNIDNPRLASSIILMEIAP